MLRLSEWERDNFRNTSHTSDLTVIFPSREIYFSPELLNVMRLSPETCPKTLDQWYELCHPEDHTNISRLEQAVYGHDNFVSLTRKLYCGDGYYRSFRLDAFIQRDNDGRPARLMGSEVLALSSWLARASEGDMIECDEPGGRTRVLEAVRIQGVMTLRDNSEARDLYDENMRLRRQIQRRIFGISSPAEFTDGTEGLMLGTLEDNISLALNVLPGNAQLKAIKRSLSEPCLTVGIVGLTSSGKSSFVNALLGERLIPEQTIATTNIPVICREGEFRSARICYQDGRTEDIPSRKLTQSFMKNIASESFNAGNRAGIARVEITMPGALIPEGFCFVDTPGSDSLTGAGGASLRNILPELDMIIYVTPLRARLKGSDYELLRMILNMNDRMIFVLSQTDLERDDSEAGRVVNSAHDKIISDVQALRHDMRRFGGRDFDVIPVSAKNALGRFYDRQSDMWINSNIESVVNYFASMKGSALRRAVIFRAERALKVLDGVLSGREVTGSSRWRVQDIAGKLRTLLRTNGTMPETWGDYEFSRNIPDTKIETKNLLSSLITSMREREFRTRFFSLKAFSGKRKAVLLGAERNQSLKLFSRLSHNLMRERLPDGGVSYSEWLYSGYSAPFGCIMLPESGDVDILIAPSNSDITHNPDWHKLFREYVPVVSVDLARVDSGLSDLAYSPYITGLALSEWVLAFGNAGLFDTRQIDLVSQVPQRVKEFVGFNGLKEPEWFIFENYKIF